MDVERLPLEFHDDGLLYCFDSDELYTGVWKKSLAGVIVEEGFYSDGLADGKWIYRNQDNSIKSTELYEDGFRISWSSPDTNGQLSVGATVKHAKFGLGTVLNFEGNEEHKIENHEKPEWIKTIQQKNEDDISNAQEANSKRKEEFERDYQSLLYFNDSFQDINVELVLMDIEFYHHSPDKPRLLLKTNSRSLHGINIKRDESLPKDRTLVTGLLGDAYWVYPTIKPKWVDHKTSEERSVTITHEAEGFYFNFRIRTTQEEHYWDEDADDSFYRCTYRGAYDNNVSTQFGTDESILPMSMDKFYDVYKWVSYNTDETPPQIGSEVTGIDRYKGTNGSVDAEVAIKRLKVIMSLFFLLFLAVVVFN